MKNKSWLFQNDPSKYDLRGALSACSVLHWQVRGKGKNVAVGDTVYFFECSPNYWICAMGEVLSKPDNMGKHPCEIPFILDKERLRDRTRVKVKIIKKFFTNPLLINKLRQHPVLCNNKIIRHINENDKSLPGPTFKLLAGEASELFKLIP